MLLESAGTPASVSTPLEVADDPCWVLLSSTGLLARTSGADPVPSEGGRAKHDAVVGGVGQGWPVALTTLLFERLTLVAGFEDHALNADRLVRPLAGRGQLDRRRERLGRHEGAAPLFEHYGVEAEIERVLASEVALPSGGRIAIETTRALTAIDVDSGAYAGRSDLEATALPVAPGAAANAATPAAVGVGTVCEASVSAPSALNSVMVSRVLSGLTTS